MCASGYGRGVAEEASPEERPTPGDPGPAAEKDPDDWVTGDEPMTGAQASYLATLACDTGRTVPSSLTKAEASKLIEELQRESKRLPD